MLKELGLSEYEEKAYRALVSLGSATITEIAQVCDVPRPNLYQVLEKLAAKGFVEVESVRPLRYRAISPKIAIRRRADELVEQIRKVEKEAIEELSKIEKGEEVKPTLIWGIKGVDNVYKKWEKMIEEARKEIFMNLRSTEMLAPLKEKLKEAEERGVKIKIICEEANDWSIGIVRTKDRVHGIDILVDEKQVLIAPALPIMAAWVDNEEIAMHVKEFLNLLWKDARILKR